MKWELAFSILVNIVAIAFFAGSMSANQNFLKEAIKDIKEDFKEKLQDMRSGFNRKIDDNQKHTAEHISRLEEKQDRHNCLVERMATVEQSTKSAHHRLDNIKLEN